MAAAPRAQPSDYFKSAEWAALSGRSPSKGVLLIVHCWVVIALAMAMGVIWPITIPVAVVIIGTRQLGLFVLMHDGAHALLHPDRKVNDWLADWFCSSTLQAYRPYHLQHHRFVQQTEDPDLVLSAPFPITRESFARKVWRDLSGQTFYKQRLATTVKLIRDRSVDESVLRLLWGAIMKARRFWIGNVLGLAAFSAFGLWWAWLLMWLLPMVTWLPLVSRIRNIAEHALIAQNEANPLLQARTTHAGWLERALVAPYYVNYHCEHHMFTQVPCWNLPKAHQILRRDGITAQMQTQPGYVSLLRAAAAG
ncbi:MAG: fatty acid desaturase family protein [Rhodoferax sp.]